MSRDLPNDFIVAYINGFDRIKTLSDPNRRPVRDGGLALLSVGEVLIVPGSCSDLGNIAEWHKASGYRGSEWQMLWIGHPWLSIRYGGERLILSEPHESESPEGRWSVSPEVLGTALSAAEAELVDFARCLEQALVILGASDEAGGLAGRLAGLTA